MCKLTENRAMRVLLADDHQVVLHALSSLLSLYPDIIVAGIAENGSDAVHLTRKRNPDVILMDINMPEMDGVEATRIIHSEFPNIRIIGLSCNDAEFYSDAMIDAGAVGFCSKNGRIDVLLSAIRGETEGAISVPPA